MISSSIIAMAIIGFGLIALMAMTAYFKTCFILGSLLILVYLAYESGLIKFDGKASGKANMAAAMEVTLKSD